MAVEKRLKVLISAYACSPYQGSEPGVGWGFVSALAHHHDLWVIVEEEKFRADIERYLADHPALSRTIHFSFVRKQRNRWLRRIWPPSYYWYYRRWHLDTLKLARELHTEIGFDIAHQLTMVGFREPGYLWQMNIPFVWGPIGGMGLFPWRFLAKVGAYGALYYFGYNVANLLQMRYLRRPRLAALAAGSGLITATPDNRAGVKKYWGAASALLSEVGLPDTRAQHPQRRQADEEFRVAWIGSHTPGKALNLGLEALAQVADGVNWQLHIFGKGSQTSAWQSMAGKLGMAERCHFHGMVPRDQVLKAMETSHLLLITSLKDLTSTVTIEALAHGLPIVCLDHCGFAGVVDHICGIKVPVTTPAAVARELAAAIYALAIDEDRRHRLALGAVERAKEFSWENKVRMVDRIYKEKLVEREARTL